MSAIDDLLFFSRIAALGSLTAVARESGLSLPAVSKRLTQLEQRLGVQLIRRTTRRLDLTPEGQLYADGALPILHEIEGLESQVRRNQLTLRGRLTVNASFGFGRRHIAPLISAFARRHGELEVQLQLTSQPLNMLDAGVDIDIRFGAPPDSRLVAHRLMENPRVLCAAPAYLARCGTPQTVADLAGHNCLVLRQYESDYGLWRFYRDGREFTHRAFGNLSANDGEVIMRYALDGHGIILRSLWDVRPWLAGGELVALLPGYIMPEADIYAVYQQRRHVPARISAFIAWLKRQLPQGEEHRQRLPGGEAKNITDAPDGR
ncbi:HTH-type transcriptional regulator DmlR [Dickeya dianthicola]|uniref:LysR family transcriptional regulator n=1 Tax=Dickeya dianthicola TaxID=204039 RepID=A0AAP6S1P8_9GAMM|nr:LysR family transcriptional regulator [Dickeya dianthicola]AYC17784.1 HTH-type transcriptional regulator DmlR [Dickeya dianthicola]MBI0436601.1 LysR family transcriptional regulator [Dickeya dianthicola]MBI0449875.1 LysR family transcriptional regulator [Dickeya dianthicola]MBI0454342.1 LysR family transcriptional regulator [Dickeya dianthicola]MBI0458589.1 LysR family transcriptional regulator [Dickeya dianthicola]